MPVATTVVTPNASRRRGRPEARGITLGRGGGPRRCAGRYIIRFGGQNLRSVHAILHTRTWDCRDGTADIVDRSLRPTYTDIDPRFSIACYAAYREVTDDLDHDSLQQAVRLL